MRIKEGLRLVAVVLCRVAEDITRDLSKDLKHLTFTSRTPLRNVYFLNSDATYQIISTNEFYLSVH